MDLHAQDALTPPTLTTHRLTLRPFRDTDAGPIIAALNDWAITRWLTSVPFPYTQGDAAWWISSGSRQDGAVNWAIEDATGFVGTVGVKPDLGYWLAAARHGQGYMTEASTCAIDWYFQTIDAPLVSGHLIGNAPSRAILLKQGFRDTVVEDVIRTGDQQVIQVQKLKLGRSDWSDRHV